MFILLMVLKETDNHHRPLLCRLPSVGNHVPDVSIVQEWTIWMSIYLQIYRYPSIATLFAPSSWSTFRQEQETTEATHLLNAIPHRRIVVLCRYVWLIKAKVLDDCVLYLNPPVDLISNRSTLGIQPPPVFYSHANPIRSSSFCPFCFDTVFRLFLLFFAT